jgi:hypothetical protein
MSSYEADPAKFATPAVEIVFALAVAGLSGVEYSVMLAAIGHCFGAPRWELKGALLRVSRHWLAARLPWARAGIYRAIDNLVRRGLLRTAANRCLIINKRLHEWLGPDGRPLFGPREAATANLHAHLARWPWFEDLASKVPLGAGPLFGPPETAPKEAPEAAKANAVPPRKTSTPVDATSTTMDSCRYAMSTPVDCQNGKTSTPVDVFVHSSGLVAAKTPQHEAGRGANEIEMAGRFGWLYSGGLNTDQLVTYAATVGRLPATDRPRLHVLLQTCLQQGLDASRLVLAVEDYANNDAPGKITNPLAYIRSRIQNPARSATAVANTFRAWLDRERRRAPSPPPAPDPAPPGDLTRQDSEAAAAFSARPTNEQLAAIDELRRAGDSLLAIRLQSWRAEGAPAWRDLPPARRNTLARAMAAAERVCRGVLAEFLRGA